MRVFVILKGTGFRYTGELLSETDSELIIDDYKLGRMEISKDQVAVRGRA